MAGCATSGSLYNYFAPGRWLYLGGGPHLSRGSFGGCDPGGVLVDGDCGRRGQRDGDGGGIEVVG